MIITLTEALACGRGTERPFNCPNPDHDDANASASVNVVKGLWYCPSPTTRLLTADLRWQEIGTMAVGDALVGFDENVVEHGKRQWRTSVVEALEHIEQPCYDIVLADGRTIRASAGHQWLVELPGGGHRQWRTTASLAGRNGYFCKIMAATDVWEHDTSREAGYLAAAFDGEGSLIQRRRGRSNRSTEARLLFYQRPNTMLDEVERCLRAKGFAYGKYLRKDGCYHLLIQRKEDVLRFLGQIRPQRLLDKFDPDLLGGMSRLDWVDVNALVDVGMQPVVAMKTSTSTYVAEGLASHNCYACMAHGVLDDHVPTVDEALAVLSGRAKPRAYPQTWLDIFDADHASPYWAARVGLDVASANRCGTSLTGHPTYPIRGPNGHLWGVVERHDDDPGQKYHYPYAVSVSQTLYGPLRRADVVVLVEGASDVLALEQALLPPRWLALGCYGAGLKYPQVALVARANPKVVLTAFDADEAGCKAAERTHPLLEDIAPVVSHPWATLGVNDAAAAPITDRIPALIDTLADAGYRRYCP